MKHSVMARTWCERVLRDCMLLRVAERGARAGQRWTNSSAATPLSNLRRSSALYSRQAQP